MQSESLRLNRTATQPLPLPHQPHQNFPSIHILRDHLLGHRPWSQFEFYEPASKTPTTHRVKPPLSKMPPPSIPHLPPSSLGQKSYWDTAYDRELTNYTSTGTDEGTIWFSDADAEERVISFLEDLYEEGELQKEAGAKGEGGASRILDLGTGNGHFLFALRGEGWRGEMVGVDYSERSVELARGILEGKRKQRTTKGQTEPNGADTDGADGEQPENEESEDEEEQEIVDYDDISFHTHDILEPISPTSPPSWLSTAFDLVLDKGTFDAICLSEETDSSGRRICEGYKDRVLRLVKPGGRFLVTSCNWTGEELRAWFDGKEGGFEFESEVKYPTFRFGGKEGSQVASCCFRRV